MRAQVENGFESAISKIRDLLIDGFSHGFFKYTLDGEVLRKGEMLALTIYAGKSSRHVIDINDLPK